MTERISRKNPEKRVVTPKQMLITGLLGLVVTCGVDLGSIFVESLQKGNEYAASHVQPDQDKVKDAITTVDRFKYAEEANSAILHNELNIPLENDRRYLEAKELVGADLEYSIGISNALDTGTVEEKVFDLIGIAGGLVVSIIAKYNMDVDLNKFYAKQLNAQNKFKDLK